MATAEDVLIRFVGVNQVSPTTQAIKKDINSINQSLQGVDRKAQGTGQQFNQVGAASQRAGQSITSSMRSSMESIGMVGFALTSLLGGFSALTIAQSAMSGAMAQQSNMALLTRKFGAEAESIAKNIQTIVSEVPGDDTFMNQLLSGAAYKAGETNVALLKEMGTAAADYMATSSSMGKNMIETQMDLREYFLTGNTTQLERDSILKGQLDKLKGQETVQDRIKALNEALNAEGYKGTATMDTMANKWETFKGKLQLAATMLGTSVLPTLEAIVNTLTWADEVTGGWSTTLIVIGGFFIGLAAMAAMFLEPLILIGGAISWVGGGLLGLLIPGLTGTMGASMGAGGALDYLFLSLVAAASGEEMATVASWGLLPSLQAIAGAVWTAIAPFLPFIIAIVAVIAILWYLYNTNESVRNAFNWLGSEMQKFFGWLAGGAIAVLKELWNVMAGFFGWIQSTAMWIWNGFVGSFFDAEGNFVGLIQGFQNLGGAISNAITTVIWPALQALPGQIWGFLVNLFSSGGGAGSIGAAIAGWFSGIDWWGVLRTALTGLVAMNPVMLIARLIFGDKAANAATAGIVDGIIGMFQGIISAVTWFYSAIRPGLEMISYLFRVAFSVIMVGARSLWDSLQGVVNPLINIFGILWGAVGVVIENLINAWNKFTGAFFDDQGKFVGIVEGLMNVGGELWNWITTFDWIGLGQSILSGVLGIGQNLLSAFTSFIMAIPNMLYTIIMGIDWVVVGEYVWDTIVGGLTGLGQYLWTAIFGGGEDAGPGIADQIMNTIMGIDWMGIIRSIVSYVATYNPITLLVTALFGEEAGAKFSQDVTNFFMTGLNYLIRGLTFLWMIVNQGIGYLRMLWGMLTQAGMAIWGLLAPLFAAGQGFFQFLGWVWNAMWGALGAVMSVGGQIMDFIWTLPGKLYDAGMKIIDQLAQGIRDAAGNAVGAVQEVIDAVLAYLPHSPAKEGPLKYLSDRGVSFWKEYSKGLELGAGTILRPNIGDILSTLPVNADFQQAASTYNHSSLNSVTYLMVQQQIDASNMTPEQFQALWTEVMEGLIRRNGG